MKTKEVMAEQLGINLDEVRDILSLETLNSMGMLSIKGGYIPPDLDDDETNAKKCNGCGGCKADNCDKCHCS